ncbi:A-kinase anchor protein 1, mitochondrial [Athene cunicularia]|uniref:A-kinase anchoring protein 1 n=1 Tax=Athene cunicularia TaxID=194338 RepID=A0A663M8P6_ATHCN|nr:A-kinase anchor protein 1, mitochondrial [Athene cunicularia]XP_026717562.1 A-kinase anchor protein 1, mitochondrial [Athene cunicularia]XP_026717563.1 A-kinase anchor protein 1, mitochondrial [Athene cunicularia]XP_026717564.1 A-kinase anchor protein 1, mitochondrial [Athene cunicularia]XP_026717565.1 A-kinase anchor protein 1, mitochondrial [Athene cunicularia]
MALRFRSFIPYAIPGVLALLGCWWIFAHRKKHAGYHDKQAIVIEEVLENDSSPKTEVCVPQRLSVSWEEQCPEIESSTSLLSAGLMTPSLLLHTHERLDLSQDLLDLSVTTVPPNALEDDSEKLDTIGSQDESHVPACVSLPLISRSPECRGSAAGSLKQDSSSSANQDQWPSASLTQEPPGVTEGISSAEQSDESSFQPAKESQVSEIVLSHAGSVTAPCLGLEKEANTPRAFLNNEVVSSHKDSAVSVLPDSSEPACLEQPREEEEAESLASAVPACREEDSQPEGDELEREEIGGVSLAKEEVEKIEQVAIQIISKVILAATEEVLSGSASDVSTWICQAAASRGERPLEAAGVVPSEQTLAEEAPPGGEDTAARRDAVVLTSPQPEARDPSVAESGCSTHGRLSVPLQGDTRDCRTRNRVCSEARGMDRAPVESHGGPLERSPVVMEDSGCSTYTFEGGTSVEDPLQNAVLSAVAGRQSDSPGRAAAQGTSAEQSSAPSEKNPTLKLPEDSEVPYSNGILKEDGPDSHYECSRAAGTDGDHLAGSDVSNMEFVDSGCAMRKTVTRQNSKLEGEPSKSDFVIWEIEVPKKLVGRLIGKQGRFMSFLRQASGAKIYVSTLPYFRDSQVCHIEGSPQQVEKVLSLIGRKFKELCLTNIYALPPPTPLTLHSLLMTAWLFLPDGVSVEVVVANQVDAGHMFLQQHTHPTFHVLRSLDQQMYACYSQPEIPTLPTPVEVGIICAAPGLDGAWLRAQVISYFEETSEVELRYVDYGGYDKVKIDTLRQIRSDFLSLPFQGAEVLLDNVVPLPDEDHFSSEANAAVSEMTRGAVLVAQVTNYDSATGLPLIQLWNLMGDEVVSINRTLVERGFAQWLDY